MHLRNFVTSIAAMENWFLCIQFISVRLYCSRNFYAANDAIDAIDAITNTVVILLIFSMHGMAIYCYRLNNSTAENP